MPDIFVSHSTKDDAIVDLICQEIVKATGQEIWIDHHVLKPGSIWQDEIDKALRTCPYIIVVISKNSYESMEVISEWRLAASLNHKLIPVIIDDVSVSAIAAPLRIIQWISLFKDWTSGIQQIIKAVKPPKMRKVTGFKESELRRTPIRGRAKDLDVIRKFLAIEQSVIFIVGLPGSGKSRLAAEIAFTSTDIDGVIWYSLTQQSDPSHINHLLKKYLGLSIRAKQTEVYRELALHGKILIVIDIDYGLSIYNIDYKKYIDLARKLSDYGAKLLLTAYVEPGPTKGIQIHHLSELHISEAKQIAIDMMEIRQIEELQFAEEIALAARLHPQLIEWAIIQSERNAISEVIQKLKDIKVDDLKYITEKQLQNNLNKMIVDEENGFIAEQVLKQLVVCRGGFNKKAAEAIVANLDPTFTKNIAEENHPNNLKIGLELLQKWCFVNKIEMQRYNIPRIILTLIEPSEDTYKAHFSYYSTLIRDASFEELESELENLQAAFDWIIKEKEYEKAFRFTWEYGIFFLHQGYFEQYKNWVDKITSLIFSGRAEINPIYTSYAHSLRGNMYLEYPSGEEEYNIEQAIKEYEKVLELAPQEQQLHINTQINLGSAYRKLAQHVNIIKNLELAIGTFKKGLQNLHPTTQPDLYSSVLNNLGVVYHDLARYQERHRAENLQQAEYVYREALIYLSKENNPIEYSQTQSNLSEIYIDYAKDKLQQAFELVQDAIGLVSNEQTSYLANTQSNKGNLLERLNKIKEAINNMEEANRGFEMVDQ